MRYLEKRFTVGSTTADAQEKYREGWERTFGKRFTEKRQNENHKEHA